MVLRCKIAKVIEIAKVIVQYCLLCVCKYSMIENPIYSLDEFKVAYLKNYTHYRYNFYPLLGISCDINIFGQNCCSNLAVRGLMSLD